MDLEKMSNLLGADLAKKVYEDGASESTKELGKVATDVIKTFRLFTAPVQLAAAYQDRLAKYLDKVRNNVKPENQIEAPASIAGPTIDRLKYLDEDNYLTNLYLNLLTRAIDKERINEAHPAFFHLIDQLSPDEAMILYLLKHTNIFIDYRDPIVYEKNEFHHWGKREIVRDTTPKDKLQFFENFEMYVNHLRAMNLVFWNKRERTPIYENKIQTHAFEGTEIGLTDFGYLFVKACIPEDGFEL